MASQHALASQGDVDMPDAQSSAPPDIDSDVDKERRIRVLPGSTPTATSFQFKGEDHTLGNALRYIVMKKYAKGLVFFNLREAADSDGSPGVEFCGYSIPHPSEPKMNIRIQTYDGTTAMDALAKGLDDLMDLCDVVLDKFIVAKSEYGR
ncbi:MAG: RNA polymerase subunit AC19 [Trizodia sp. TS-e1964]|nr:MAG: RNA polymerase subunit AC19 [Trizodia sp. TS-e1964]